MISFDDAVHLLGTVARPLGIETISIDQAAGRVLASAVMAQIDSPRSDVSAMDGYAVREQDLKAFPVRLHLVGEAFAGRGWDGCVEAGTCVRIFTGAPVPAGADRVVIQEDVRSDAAAASIDDPPGPARYIRKCGSDFSEGEQLLAAGRALDSRAIVAAAAADVAQVDVYRRTRVTILSTGDELAAPGTARRRRDAIPDSVSLGVETMARQWGAECLDRRRLPDDLDTMKGAAEAAVVQSDLVVVTGGASVGKKDFAKTMFEPLGMSLVFSKVAMKPGKPVWLGRVGETLVIGLPGNPTSALATARLLLAPLLAGLSGQPIERALAWRSMSLATPLGSCGVRETFHRARLNEGLAEVLTFQDSSAQKALVEADLLVRQRANDPGLEAGDSVDVLDF